MHTYLHLYIKMFQTTRSFFWLLSNKTQIQTFEIYSFLYKMHFDTLNHQFKLFIYTENAMLLPWWSFILKLNHLDLNPLRQLLFENDNVDNFQQLVRQISFNNNNFSYPLHPNQIFLKKRSLCSFKIEVSFV